MSQTAHDYAVMLERVMCFGVSVEALTRQERVDRAGMRKPSSRHVPSGSFRISLHPGGSLLIQNPDNNDPIDQFSESRRLAMLKSIQGALRPTRDRLATQFKAAIQAAQDVGAARVAVLLSTMIKELDSMQVLASCPPGMVTLSLAGSVTVAGPDADKLREELVTALESVLRPAREAGTALIRKMALDALEQP